jgi:lipopolysaccharide/colanic/teichoic acid biosynthesis glycosyltransferase
MSKRALDIAGALVGLTVFAPIMAIVAIAVALRLGRPIFFRQPRLGQHGKVFELIKFRTMRDAQDDRGCLLPDGERLTSLGRKLRSSSLDELPEFWNVLRGDMSLVGPRPLLVDYRSFYTPIEMRRHTVRPGLTGLAQVRGRNALTWRQKFRYDCFYVDHASLAFDLQILWMTFAAVFLRRGISAAGEATMPRLDVERRAS